MEEEATQTETSLYNGGMIPFLDQFPSQSSCSVDAPNVPDSSFPGVQEDVIDTARLVVVSKLPGKSLTAAYDKIFGICQDRVNQNPGTHMDFSIEEDGESQERCKNWCVCPPNVMTYLMAVSQIDLLVLFCWILTEFGIFNRTQRG